MPANVCVEHGYEVSLYRHSAFLIYVIVRFFLFVSLPDFIFIYVIA